MHECPFTFLEKDVSLEMFFYLKTGGLAHIFSEERGSFDKTIFFKFVNYLL